jgi:hypothetical protein
MPVKVANGQIVQSDREVRNLEWWIQGLTFISDARVLDLTTYDLILGMDWLEQHSPMKCDWLQKSIQFEHKGTLVTLQGILPSDTASVSKISGVQFHKLAKGNDIWALAAVVFKENPEEKQEQYMLNGIPREIQAVIQDNANLFVVPDSLPPSRAFDHAKSLYPDSVPVNCKPYRYSPHQKDEIEKQVFAMLKDGTVTPCLSPFASPVLLVKKKDGSWRFCVDYRKLNASTVKNKFPTPVIDEFLDEIAGAKVFTKLDLNSGFHQIRMKQGDEHKIAFKTHHGHFEFKVMPFKLTNAPATFQCLMNSVFAAYMRKFDLIFVDDTLIYSHSMQDHIQHLSLVFQVLREHQLFIKFKKCAFGQNQIDYLGHIISDQGVSTDPAKTSIMLQWPTPSIFIDVR